MSNAVIRISLVLGVFLILGKYITPIWIGVSFMIYLLKDSPFEWLSIFAWVVSWMFYGITFIWMVYVIKKTDDNYSPKEKKEKKMSAFQKKLQDAIEIKKSSEDKLN